MDFFDETSYKSLKDIEELSSDLKGVYAICATRESKLPDAVKKEVFNGGGFIIYANNSSNIKNELFNKCNGTDSGNFLKRLGALLDFKPPKGSLVGKTEIENFEFSVEDKSKIREWIYDNLFFNYIVLEEDQMEAFKEHLVIQLSPVLNVQSNPFKSVLLNAKMDECFLYAKSEII